MGKDHKVHHVIIYIYTGARGGDRGHIISNKLSGRNDAECLELKRRNYGALKSNTCALLDSDICRFLTI
jgi:hypothetical protein